jgi:release factor glutamine methyltransferase
VYAEEEARLLAAAASGSSLEALVARRVAGEPLEQVLGWASFAGLRVLVPPGVFVPRRRTELLVALATAAVRDAGAAASAGRPAAHLPPPVVVDLCCGSGAVGAAVAAACPHAEVWAADVDPVAVAGARRNLPAERVVLGDLYDPLPHRLRGRVDVVAVNAPYVPTDAIPTMPREARDHEPRVALDGGPDGVAVHRRVAAGAGEWLRPGGLLVIETSAGQAAATAGACHDAGLVTRVVTDDELDAVAVLGSLVTGVLGRAP